MKEIQEYIKSNKEKFLDELFDFLKIPSVSSQSVHNGDMVKCVDWLVEHIKKIGINDVRIIETGGHPIVYAEWIRAGKSAPTILIYGHYDVQPIEPLELWDSPPFKPEIRNGKIWGRGTADDKGQLFCHLKSIEAYFKTIYSLPVNIKLLIEGEEEAGFSHIEQFINDNAELLACDTALVSDTEWIAEGMPSICYGLRGISIVELTVMGPNRDLHSGSFGGVVDNPIHVLCWMVNNLKDRYGRVTIPGFYDDVLNLTNIERENFKKLPYDEQLYSEDLGVKALTGEITYNTYERAWARPALDVIGIYGGYTGEGAKTIIPSTATAKISMRLVPYQNPEDINKKIENYLKAITPPTVRIDIKVLHGGKPALAPLDSPGIKAAAAAMREAFGKEPVFMREGGSIPVVEQFQSVLKAPTVLMSLGLPSDNIHSPNENFDVNNFYGGIMASALFFYEISK